MFSSVRLALASSSPQRMKLLQCLGIDCQHCPVDVDESELHHEAPHDYVTRVAFDKAQAGIQQYAPTIPVLAADTVIVIDDKILGKPDDKEHARHILQQLSGRVHQVFTGVVLSTGGSHHQIVDQSQVWFDELTPVLLESYLATEEFKGKAGAYAIQGMAQAFIHRIEGSFSGVMGLPLHSVTLLLDRAGFLMGAAQVR